MKRRGLEKLSPEARLTAESHHKCSGKKHVRQFLQGWLEKKHPGQIWAQWENIGAPQRVIGLFRDETAAQPGEEWWGGGEVGMRGERWLVALGQYIRPRNKVIIGLVSGIFREICRWRNYWTKLWRPGEMHTMCNWLCACKEHWKGSRVFPNTRWEKDEDSNILGSWWGQGFLWKMGDIYKYKTNKHIEIFWIIWAKPPNHCWPGNVMKLPLRGKA